MYYKYKKTRLKPLGVIKWNCYEHSKPLLQAMELQVDSFASLGDYEAMGST